MSADPQALGQAQVPEEYRECCLESFRGYQALCRQIPGLQQWDGAGRPAVVYIHGEVGVGKTHLAVGLFGKMLAAGHPGIWIDCLEWITALKEAFDADRRRRPEPQGYGEAQYTPPREASRLRALWQSPGVVLVDDLGKEQLTDFSRTELYHGINWRFSRRRPLVITSNLTEAELRRFSEPMASRLLGFQCLQIGLAGKDRRRMKNGGGAYGQ